jgi:SAM-dependent methyltransferase
MLGRDLVRPLEDDWRDTLDAVARARGWPTTHDASALAARVAALSAAYNDPARARAAVRDAGAARLGFSFARDVPKGAAAVRELVATGALALRGAPLRVLDVGAGLGATTWGVVRALAAAGASGTVEATCVDDDARALELASEIARARGGQGSVQLRATPVPRPLAALGDRPRFDLVLAGNVLSELDVGAPPATRVERHAELLHGWVEQRLAPGGSLVIVEPALRDRTRHLHRVRDELAARGTTIFAPCLHSAPCPALVRETDWCHEDLAVDLPGWLAPVARAAGLRREGLTFSYLVLRGDATRLGARLRVVSEPMPSKGKIEAFLCGLLADGGGLVAARTRVTRLDRDASAENAAWDRIVRGDLVAIDPAPDVRRPRVGPATQVSLSGDTKSR